MTAKNRASVRQTAKYWDAVFAAAPSLAGPDERVVTLGRELRPGARVLDVGCGEGSNVVALAQLGHHVDALDFAPGALKKCEQTAEARGVGDRVRTFLGDMTTHKYRRARYDLVTAIASLNTITHREDGHPIGDVIARIQAATVRGGRNYFQILCAVRKLVVERGLAPKAMTENERREAWDRGEHRAKPVGAMTSASAARILMQRYGNPGWELELFEFPRRTRLYAFGTRELRRSFWLEFLARRA